MPARPNVVEAGGFIYLGWGVTRLLAQGASKLLVSYYWGECDTRMLAHACSLKGFEAGDFILCGVCDKPARPRGFESAGFMLLGSV